MNAIQDLPETELEMIELEDVVAPGTAGEVAQAVIIGGVIFVGVVALCC
ncbi:hypothetical protein [Deinococcus alpinitundrae]|nr:hypothetical protein [Deinococcus alpinitundrae]